jgi:hypothetical protein
MDYEGTLVGGTLGDGGLRTFLKGADVIDVVVLCPAGGQMKQIKRKDKERDSRGASL